MPYRPFGKYRQVGGYHVGDQAPDPPEELRRAVDGDERPEFNRFERLVYGWLNRPHLLPRIGKREGR